MANSLTGACLITVCNITLLFERILSGKCKGCVEKPFLTIFFFGAVTAGFTAFKTIIQLLGARQRKRKSKDDIEKMMVHTVQNDDSYDMFWPKTLMQTKSTIFKQMLELEKNILI